MPTLIDGHNLIPKLPGFSLEEMDDEERLIGLLQDYCRKSGHAVEVYFDRGAPGQPAARNYGRVIAHFVRAGRSADDALRARLDRLGREARNWVVVSSDLAVQNAARVRRAQVLSSEAFAAQVRAVLETTPDPGASGETALSADDVDEWLNLFGGE